MDTVKMKKYFKVACIICMVAYVLLAAVGVLITKGVIPPEVFSETFGVTELTEGPDAAMYIPIIGVIIAISYGIRFFFTIPVLYGIKHPSKMMPGIVLYGILAVLITANLIMTLVRGGDVNVLFAQFIADVCIFLSSIKIYRTEK